MAVREVERSTMVVLLRGINVGGHNKLPMATLRSIATDAGFGSVQTYIQSGNLIVRTDLAPQAVAARLRDAIEAETGLTPDLMVRTHAELAAVVAGNPFVNRGEDAALTHVQFVDGPAPETLGVDDLDSFAPEEVALVGREIYLFLPEGMSQSKLPVALAKVKTRSVTQRNWRTTTKLLAMADEAANPATPAP